MGFLETLWKAFDWLLNNWKVVIGFVIFLVAFALVPGLKTFYRTVVNGFKEIFTKSGIVIFCILVITLLILLSKMGVI